MRGLTLWRRGAEAARPEWLAQVMAGQRWVIAGFLVQFLALMALEPSGGVFIELLLWLVALGCCWVGTSKLATALNFGIGTRVALLLSVGCLSLLGLPILLVKANSVLRRRGYELGLFGVSNFVDTEDALKQALQSVPEGHRRDLEVSFQQASRSRRRALALSFWLGGLGADRFYLGQVGWGLLKMFTGGGFWLWWFIDMFCIQAATDRHNLEVLRALVRVHRGDQA